MSHDDPKNDAKHTPGPWLKIQDHNGTWGIYPDAPSGKFLVTTDTEANACLIAAAPELLEALEAMIRYGEDGPAKGETGYDIELKAKAAIRKARGEEQSHAG